MLQITDWPYMQDVSFTGNIEADIPHFLYLNGKQETAKHCIAVARMAEQLAAQFDVDIVAASTAALLHDISAVINPADMLEYALSLHWSIYEAEIKLPFLLHQRVSAVIAKEAFQISEEGVLSAIACHTTLKSDPSPLDMVLFLADKLAWDQEGIPPFFDLVQRELKHSLSRATLAYIHFVLEHGMILFPHPWLLEAKGWLEKQ